jgi:Reverse transcriptase (RNA-dependent DNA polymerase)
VYDVKHDGRHKARLVAGGHLTDTPVDSVYSSVVSLRGLRMVIFLAELNGLELWATDIGNAYLEAYTKEKVYIIAGPEFGDREGHTLLIDRALYGLKSSGVRWHERFSVVLDKMGFFPSKAENDIWMRKVGDHYEYIARYVDDLAIASKNPKAITDALTNEHKFKLKGTGPISYHLGCDFYRDEHGVLCMRPKAYIEKIVDNYERLFGSKPKTNVTSPLEKGDHPELDTTEEEEVDGIKRYQSLIGALQWAISLGRFDIATAVMTLSKFRAAPRKGHTSRVKRIFGYLSKMKNATIRFRTAEPDYSAIPEPDLDWTYSVYGQVKEVVPHDAPEPLGKSVVHTAYVDANLLHDLTTGRSVTAVLHFFNQTPIDWYTKKQATVETATYGSEFVAARTAVEQTMDLRTTLRYLGVPVKGATYLFGDNESVVNSSVNPASKLHKRHTALSYHRVREAIAAKVVKFIYIPGDQNPADILSKAWGYQQVWPMLRAILFWEGDPNEALGVGHAAKPNHSSD